MQQLKFSNTFSYIVDEDISNYWHKKDDIKDQVKSFIEENNNKLVIENGGKYYCFSCLTLLDSNCHCPNCGISYDINLKKYVLKCYEEDIFEFSDSIYYYVFDMVCDDIILYKISNAFNYKKLYGCYKYYRQNKLTVEKAYQVLKNGLLDLNNDKFLSFDKLREDIEHEEEWGYTKLMSLFTTFEENSFVYSDNLHLLKNNELYRYSYLWQLENHINDYQLSLINLTFNPICCLEFEYLIKMGLYRLAFSCYLCLIHYQNNFYNTFKLDKKYYNFMKENDIDYSELKALQSYPKMDISLIKFISSYSFILEQFKTCTTISKIKNYLEKQNLSWDNIYEYYDYIENCQKIGLDLNNEKVLFPKNFMQAHNNIILQSINFNDKSINDEIAKLSSLLKVNCYEDNLFSIFPASSVESLIDESNQMSNCVRTYFEKYSKNECQIYFMRYKNSLNKSLVTIEVINGKVVQARTKYNNLPSEYMLNVINKWARNIILIKNV